MGGCGSGRSGAGKVFVESCRDLDINWFVQEGVVRPDRGSRGVLRWTRDGEEVASIGHEVEAQAQAGGLRLFYAVTPAGGEPVRLDYKVPLVTTRIVSGGRR